MHTPEEYSATGGDELINHAKKIAIDPLQFFHEVMKKYEVVSIGQRFEEWFTLMIRGNKNCRIVWNFLLHIGIDGICIQ